MMFRNRKDAEDYARLRLYGLKGLGGNDPIDPHELARAMDRMGRGVFEDLARMDLWGFGLLPEGDPAKMMVEEWLRNHPFPSLAKEELREKGWVRGLD